MREVRPGIWHWTTFYDSIGQDVSSYWIEPAGIVIDGMVPDDVGLGWWDDRDVQPQQLVLTIGLHWRHNEQFAERFGAAIRVPAASLERYQGTDRAEKAEPYSPGDEIAPGVTAVEIGGIAPDETALHIAHGDGAVSIADGLLRAKGGAPLSYMPEFLLGDDPATVKSELHDSLRGLLDREWDTLLLAHGDPIESGAKQALKDFLG